MCENLLVEIYVLGAYYKGSVIDVYNDGVYIQFEDGLEKATFPFTQVRLPPVEKLQVNVGTVGTEVEIFSRANVNGKYGWWCAVVKMRGEVLDIECSGWENGFEETVGLEQIRNKNPNPPINIETFSKYELAVPIELRELSKLCGVHQMFKQTVGADICHFDVKRGLLCLISKNRLSEALVENALLWHFMYLRGQLEISVLKEELLKKDAELEGLNDENLSLMVSSLLKMVDLLEPPPTP